MVLVKTINVTTLKAKASQAIREVRAGETYIILDRDVPVARIVPLEEEGLNSSMPVSKYKWPKLKVRVTVDPVDYLVEDRRRR